MRLSPIVAGLAALCCAFPAFAFDPFVVKDIRVEGIQRTEAGTVFTYLPIKVGDTVDEEKAAEAVKALFSTGFFKDVRIENEGGILVVMVQERPAISQIDITGTKEFDKDQLKTALKDVGLAESRVFDKALLEKAEQELKRQYVSRGKYAAAVKTTVTPLERNRVAVSFDVEEGDAAKIRQINIVGNNAFKDEALTDLFVLRTPGWFTWFTKDDQYSKQKLAADLETLRSFYLNQGYLEFRVDSTQVQITPDKLDIFITVNVTEGEKYTVSDVKLGGEMLVPEAELRKLVTLKPGDIFSRERVNESSKAISDRLGNDGYAFANVSAVPEINKEKKEAAFTFFIDPGRRVYVRRINIAGNNRTRDEVLRREMRQLEGAYYSQAKINRSKERVDKLGYFKDVNVETPAVPGTTDQVDVNFTVEEKPTGNILLGAGLSSSDGFIVSGSVSQNNIFGSGNHLSIQANTSSVNTVYALSYTNPYYTVDGISLGADLYKRDVDSTSLDVGRYTTKTLGATLRVGLPVTEYDTVNLGLGFESTDLDTFNDSPQRYKDFVSVFGASTKTLLGTAGWARDGRDSLIYPTKGTYQRVSGEVGLPGGDLTYYKASYQHQWFYPLTRTFTLMLNGEVGVGGGFQGKPLPFFKNFFAGGVSSVRGYDNASLGPRDSNGEVLGGDTRVVANAEIMFPFPGLKNDKSIRLGAFIDAGAVKGEGAQAGTDGLRYATGISVVWSSPVGPIKLSVAEPLNEKTGDKTQRFQFQLGSAF